MDEGKEALVLDVRRKIYRVVEKNPGLHFREIQRRTKLAIGSLQYHLDYLEKKHMVRTSREGKFVRYYSVRGKQLNEDEKTMSLLRQDSVRKIVLFLLSRKRANNETISAGVGLSPSTVSWHLDKLLKAGVVEKRRRGRKSFFSLTNPESTGNLIASHGKSFLDDMVDSFVEIWETIDTEELKK